jgi:DNA-directed RNA polymerase I, II, and III subunit RPABC1
MSANKNDKNVIQDIINSRKHILNMLSIRGYDISTYENCSSEELLVKIETENNQNQNFLDIETHKLEDPTKKIFVRYLWRQAKIKTNTLENVIKDLIPGGDVNKDDYEIIIICKDKKTESIQKTIDKFVSNKYHIQYFWIKTLLYNILEHDFVPHHRILSDEEKIQIKKKYNITNNQMPIILRNDAVAQYMGMKTGDMCEITRKSETSGEYKSYRICV